MPSTTGFGPSRPKPSASHESISAPINYRDASSSSRVHWKHPPTPISVPTNNERPSHPHDDFYSIGPDNSGTISRRPGNPNAGQTVLSKYSSSAKADRPSRPHDNPYNFGSDTLGTKFRLGNPTAGQTVLSKPPHGSTTADPHTRKRQKFNHDIPSGPTSNGVSSSSARRPISRSNVFEPDGQAIEPRRGANNRTHPPNDAEIIDIGSSDDLGERVPRAVESSPDPILLQTPHAFETHPTASSSFATNKGKGRAKESFELVVEDSEGSDDIELFPTPPRMNRPPKSKRSPAIPKNHVRDLRSVFESTPAPASAPAAVRHPIEKAVDFVTRTITSSGTHGPVIAQMRGKNVNTHRNQRGAGAVDHIGTSSSNFLNSKHEKETPPVLPLEACCIGHHLFRHSSTAPLKLVYEPAREKVKVIWDQSPPKKIEFKLDRDVCSAIIVNDLEHVLRENVTIKLVTTPGQEWKGIEHRLKGFKGGGNRGKEALTFLFSTENDRGFRATNYQRFVAGIKQAVEERAVETVGPPKGATIWQYASHAAEMFERTESRKKEHCSESTVNGPSVAARSVTPSSSTSIETRTSRHDSKPQNGDSGSSMPWRRSARQSVIRPSRVSSPAPPPPLEPDEVILMYPPTGTGGLSIMHSDLRRLGPEEYLNDTLIEFGLKLWLNDLRKTDPTLADQIHVFSSFFYKKLHNRKNPEEGYQSVRKWTSKVDLFTKKYVIVPINENIHWYFAVIYEPGHTLEPPLPRSDTSNARLTRKRKQTQECAEVNAEVAVSEPVPTEVSLKHVRFTLQALEGEQETDVSSMNATRATTPSATGNEEMDIDGPCSLNVGSELVSATSEIQIRDSSPHFDLVYPPSECMDVDPEMYVTDVAPNETHEVAKVPDSSRSEPLSGIPASHFYESVPEREEAQPVVIADGVDSGEDQEQEAEVDNMLAVTQSSSGDLAAQTHIFTFDSLGSRHPQAIKVLGRYLEWEAKDKRNFDEVRAAVGKQVQVPVQPNTWDCGIYLLHFVKVLMSAPLEVVDQILSTRGTMPSSERRKMWQDHEIPQSRDSLKSRIMKLSEEWKAEKTSREEEASKRQNEDVMEVEELSSEGEVDIVEDIPTIKSTSRPRQKRPAMRLRG